MPWWQRKRPAPLERLPNVADRLTLLSDDLLTASRELLDVVEEIRREGEKRDERTHQR